MVEVIVGGGSIVACVLSLNCCRLSVMTKYCNWCVTGDHCICFTYNPLTTTQGPETISSTTNCFSKTIDSKGNRIDTYNFIVFFRI